MNFSIEVPAETQPLTPELVLRTLYLAVSNDPVQIRSATKQLKRWEIMPGYFPIIQDAYLDRSLPQAVRHLAVIQLKFGTEKYWRKHVTKYVLHDTRPSTLPSRPRCWITRISDADNFFCSRNLAPSTKRTEK